MLYKNCLLYDNIVTCILTTYLRCLESLTGLTGQNKNKITMRSFAEIVNKKSQIIYRISIYLVRKFKIF